MKKLSRRQFAAATLAASVATGNPERMLRVAKAQGPEKKRASTYQGPLTGIEQGVAGRQLDSLDFTRDEFQTGALRMRFRARTRVQALAWQKQLREKLTALLGGFPATRCALEPQTLESRALAGYRREKVVFQSRPNSSVFAYLLIPEGPGPGTSASGPRPAIICLPGHGRGADPVAGIDEHGELDAADKEYQHRFAVQAVERGFVALVVEMLGFGCRRDAAARQKTPGASSCQPSAGAALLLGRTMAGWRAWDVMRALDYLATRPEVDAGRVGCMGISGGGTVTLYAAALEPRIRAAVLSGSAASFRDSIFSIAHCIDNYVPGILEWAEMSDIAGLIAPRPLFVESGERDNIFPVSSAREVVAGLRRIYSLMGAPGHIGHEVFPGDHSFWGKGAFTFLDQHLS